MMQQTSAGSLQLYKNGWYEKSRSTIGDDEFIFPHKREENLIQQFATNVTSGWRAGDFKKMPFFLLRSTTARRSAHCRSLPSFGCHLCTGLTCMHHPIQNYTNHNAQPKADLFMYK